MEKYVNSLIVDKILSVSEWQFTWQIYHGNLWYLIERHLCWPFFYHPNKLRLYFTTLSSLLLHHKSIYDYIGKYLSFIILISSYLSFWEYVLHDFMHHLNMLKKQYRNSKQCHCSSRYWIFIPSIQWNYRV